MRRYSNIKIIVVLVLLMAVFVVLNFTDFSKTIKNFFYLISLPIQRTLWQIGDGASNFFSGVLEIKILTKELDALYLQNQKLISQIVALKELKKENEILRETLNLGLEKEFQLKLTQIVSKDISQDSILIDKGLEDGLSKGLPVITSQKVLLGRIGEVYQNFSEVVLISNKKSSFDAKISEKEIDGLIKGRGNFKLFLDLIPKDKEILEGDLVITTALAGVYPPGLLVGEIKEIKKSDIEPFQTAEIRPSFDIKKLDYLFIITDF